MSLQNLMRQFVGRVQTMTTTADAAGAMVITWVDVFAPVFARIETASASRVEKFARNQMDVTHELITATAGCRVGMRFLTNTGIPYLLMGTVIEPATGTIQTFFHFLALEEQPLVSNFFPPGP